MWYGRTVGWAPGWFVGYLLLHVESGSPLHRSGWLLSKSHRCCTVHLIVHIHVRVVNTHWHHTSVLPTRLWILQYHQRLQQPDADGWVLQLLRPIRIVSDGKLPSGGLGPHRPGGYPDLQSKVPDPWPYLRLLLSGHRLKEVPCLLTLSRGSLIQVAENFLEPYRTGCRLRLNWS